MKQNRYPAYPLIVHDPYFSIWSFSDRLSEDWTRHWTGATNDLICTLLIDRKPYVCMSRCKVDALPQEPIEVLPTRTIVPYEGAGIRFTMTFLTPALLNDLEVLSRPVTYVIFKAESIDGKRHNISVFFGMTGNCCTNTQGESVQWGRLRTKGMDYIWMGSAKQEILGTCGDDLRINWGRMVLAFPEKFHAQTAFGHNAETVNSFFRTGSLPEEDPDNFPEPLSKGFMALCSKADLSVSKGKSAEVWQIAAYNDLFSIEYLNRKLKGYWTKFHKNFSSMITRAMEDFEILRKRCEKFDAEFLHDAEKCGGKDYARLAALTYRQSIGAHKLVTDFDGTPLFFSKENFSNGCIATVDITYPSSPLYLLMQPELVKGMMIPILEYSSSCRWKFPFAPHDLGTYPLANGQVYGGCEESEENQMPVEESGNMLLLAAALAEFTKDKAFLKKYDPVFRKWADYLADKGFDPENQLCTDDFAGHLAHNANLSIKAILALAGYGKVCALLGKKADANFFASLAKKFASRWVRTADDGKCYRLAFDRPGSWSQKYNLIWDRLLKLGCFPSSVAEKELAWYRKHQNKYGLPLDSRKTYTKLDWILWSAALTGKDEDFQALFKPVAKWLQEGVTRVPVTDWYETVNDGAKVGFQARSVVGGIFMRMLADEKLRAKWHAQ